MGFCVNCGAQLPDETRFCPMCGTPVSQANAQANAAPPDPTREQIFYDGVCLKREGMMTVPGDCLITPSGLFYYQRSQFMKQTGKRMYSFWVNSADVVEIKTSRKNMNKVMELYLRDGTVLEFYSPKFAQMLSAMQDSVNCR